VKRPVFWILLGLVSLAGAGAAWYYFPQAFSIVALDITMDRGAALADARALAVRYGFGPTGFRDAASFALDEEAQTFVELEGGGKDALTRMLRDGLYACYTWRVRHFREGETNETLFRFTPDGRPYGFAEKLKEDLPGAALDGAAARRLGEADARTEWHIDFAGFSLVEQGQERRPGGRVDHTLTYERAAPTLNEGRYRLRLVVSGDRLTELTHFIRIPEAFTRRYQNMRSANEAIGIVSVLGLALLYVAGGIGVGLFFMLRKRWVIWRPAVCWGGLIGLMQALAAVNEWPLMWMTYDTALPRATFLGQQIATLFAMFVGFSMFFALSFMAAETLTRRAFGSHPQLWRVWAKGPGSSTAIAGRTVAAYLLVSIFFAYDVLLYLVATRAFGWWTPSEALLHPDVLATYVPWLSAIANSLQAGFWEECLFRAVPIAGAALIGDRFGQRRLFLVLAFVVQSIIFGAGHAPYPTQPSFARPVELILPSIGFGLLYLYFGLLPGIILHYTFDVVWFALPIFLAKAPGIRVQQAMVLVMTLVPLWVVLFRRVQVGRWTELSDADRNAAWTPPPVTERGAAAPTVAGYALGDRMKTIWLGIGAASLAACAVAMFAQGGPGTMPIGRVEAADLARRALEARGVALGPEWRLLPMPLDGTDAAHEFVAETADNDRRTRLVGTYLPAPRWFVRAAKFEGDVAERAEEWQMVVLPSREVRIQHLLPEGRPGASLDETAARRIAQAGLAERTRLRVASGHAREISASPARLKARTDWIFTFADNTRTPLPSGELRIDVALAGDEVTRVTRYVYVPEEWARKRRAADTRNTILRIGAGFVFGGMLVAAAVLGVIAWSRGRYAARLFLAAAALVLIASIVESANRWPTVLASLQTALPLQLQFFGVIAIGLVALTITASLDGLAIGALPQQLAGTGRLPYRDALGLGIAAGLFGAAVSLAAAALRTPEWAQAPKLAPLGAFVPVLSVAIEPISALIMRMAVLMSLFAAVTAGTTDWTRRRVFGALVLLLSGFLAAGTPAGLQTAGWGAAGALKAVSLLAVYVTLLRADLTMTPLALGTMMVVGAVAAGVQRPFPGALAGSILAALIVAAVSWGWFFALRRSLRMNLEP
jgi:hypothetical protein